jgi:hypothetical protein
MLIGALSACMEKPKGSDEGGVQGASFRVNNFDLKGSKSRFDGAIPEEVKLTLKMCITDVAHHQAITQTQFRISDPYAPERESSTVTTQGDGCLTWNEYRSFNYFAPSVYIEQVRIIEGLGFQRGTLEYHFAYNPWVVATDSKMSAFINLSAGEHLPGNGLAMVGPREALSALRGEWKDPRCGESAKATTNVNDQQKVHCASMAAGGSAQLWVDKVGITIHKENEKGPTMGIHLEGLPYSLLRDASGEAIQTQLYGGDFTVQIAVLTKTTSVDEPTINDKAGAAPTQVTAASQLGRKCTVKATDGTTTTSEFAMMHQPLPPMPAHIDTSGWLIYDNKNVVMPYKANHGQLYIALRVVSRGMNNSYLASHGVRQDVYEALYRVGPASDLLVSKGLERVAHNISSAKFKIPESGESQNAVNSTGDCLRINEDGFNYDTLLDHAQISDEIRKQIEASRPWLPAYPQTRQFAPNRIFVKPLEPKFENTVNKDDTPTERSVRFTVRACVEDSLTGRPVPNGFYRIHKINGDVDPQVPADPNGCMEWEDIVHHKYYDIQHYIIGEYRIENTDLNLDEHITLALNPWDYGWTLGRDIRHLLKCNNSDQLVTGVNANNQAEIGCMDRQALCHEGLVPFFDINNGASRLQTITCVDPDKMKAYEAKTSQQWNIRATRPTFYISQYSFNWLNQDFTIDDQLNLQMKRQYLLQMDPRVRRQDSMISGIQGRDDLRPGAYWLRVVLMRNRKDPAGRGSESGEATGVKHPLCVVNNEDVYEEKPNWDYIDKWEGVTEVVDNKIIVPVEFDFADLYMLGARNDILFEITPLDYKQSHLEYIENPLYKQLMINPAIKLTDKVTDPKANRIVLDHDSGLATPTYRARFIPVLEHGSEAAGVTCQEAEKVIAEGTSDRGREEQLAPPQEALAAGHEMFTHDYNLTTIDMRQQPELYNNLINGMRRVDMPVVGSVHTPTDQALRLWIEQHPEDTEKSVDLDLYRFHLDDLIKWIEFYPPGRRTVEDNDQGDDRLHEYQVNRYYMLRNLCTYWRSGAIYKDVFQTENPFEPDTGGWFDWMYSTQTRRVLKSADPCAEPENLFVVDKKIQIRRVDHSRNGTQYLGGQSENYNVARFTDYTQRHSEDAVLSTQDTFAFKYFDLNAKAGFDFKVGNISVNSGISRTHQWQSSRSSSENRSSAEGGSFQNSTYLIIMKMDLQVHVEDYDQCVAIKPKPALFSTVRWKTGISETQQQQVLEKGLYLCLGLQPKAGEDIYVYENYFFVAQHFNVSHLTDRNQAANRPWMILIRGAADYLKFKSTIEQHLNVKAPYGDAYGRTTRPILSPAFEAGMSPDEKNQAQSEFDLKMAKYKQQSRGRYPSYPGLFTIFEEPNYDQPLLLQNNQDPKKDCAEGVIENGIAMVEGAISAPWARRSLDCTVYQDTK